MLEVKRWIRYNGRGTSLEGLLEMRAREADDYEDPNSCIECWAPLPVTSIFTTAEPGYDLLSFEERISLMQNTINRELTKLDSKFRVEIRQSEAQPRTTLYEFKLRDTDYAGGDEASGVLEL